MSNLVVFIHGIGSSNEVWNNFIKVKKSDSETNQHTEYQPNITKIEKGKNYYYRYEYKSKKIRGSFLKNLYLEKFKGIKPADKISINNHKDSFLSFLEFNSKSFNSISIVAHSLGGIITLQSIFTLIETNNSSLKNKLTKCLLFGSPLKGSEDPSKLEYVISAINTSEILKELKPDSITINSLLKNIETHKRMLKKDYVITYIAGDADSRIIEITRDFVDDFGDFIQISGGHSEIVNPKNLTEQSFIIYKDFIKKKDDDKLTKLFADKILNDYISNKIKEFESESDTLKTLQKDIFVNLFDITCNNTKVNGGNNLEYLYNLCNDLMPKFLLSNYGMGKSTIAKQLFQYINLYSGKKAIFINLHLKELKHYYIESGEDKFFNKIFTSKIFEDIFINPEIFKNKDYQKKDFCNYYYDLLKSGELILIFDGLDEVNITSTNASNKISLKNEELNSFLNTIYSSKYSILITCRKEYNLFYNSYNLLKHKGSYEIELMEWDRKQWEYYFTVLEEQKKYKNIKEFKEEIFNYKYADLPKRPLFLSMLTELIVFNNNITNIAPELKTNLSEIYDKYIEFCLYNDLNYKTQELRFSISNQSYYISVWKKLLIKLAFEEYYLNKRLTLNRIIKIGNYLDPKEKIYEKDLIESTLSSSALFSIIHRQYNSNEFNFSHKSFLEYLIAHYLAEDIFTDNLSDATCSEAWTVYQTNEIHHHFMEELVRIAFHKKIITPNENQELDFSLLLGNKYIETAFQKILNSYTEKKNQNVTLMMELFEDYQAIIYYIGKFKIINLKKYLDDILENQAQYNTVYFRTVSLSLSSIHDDSKYCDDYVLKIINLLLNHDDDSMFYENINIQKKYHGSNPKKLRNKLKANITKFLQGEMINNISLIILTYYTTFKVTEEEILQFTDELKEIEKVAKDQGYTNIIMLVQYIPKIWLIMIGKHYKELIY